MAYENSEGKEIKKVVVDVEKVSRLFDDFSKKIPDTLMDDLDNLEYEIIGTAEVSEVNED